MIEGYPCYWNVVDELFNNSLVQLVITTSLLAISISLFSAVVKSICRDAAEIVREN